VKSKEGDQNGPRAPPQFSRDAEVMGNAEIDIRPLYEMSDFV
jgi:hypothetical protein